MMKQLLGAALAIALIGCSNDEETLNVPDTYTFTRDGQSTVVFSGQTDRIRMATELSNALADFEPNSILADQERLLHMYYNEGENGADVDPFTEDRLNASTKSIYKKVAASRDYFSDNTVESAEFRNLLEQNIISQAQDIYPNRNTAAEPGIAGQINDDGVARYVDPFGIEYDQIVEKTLIGALMADQMLNHYLSTSVLDEGNNRSNNDAGITEPGKPYTTMEHKWDEAYGYLFGNATNASDPLAELGDSDDFINKYLARVNNDDSFAGIGQRIYDAFKRGRAAIVEGDYAERDAQAKIIRDNVSDVIAIRAVYYLMAAKHEIESGNRVASLHDLSEGIGFINSLRFTRNTDTQAAYFTLDEVTSLRQRLLDSNHGLWTVTPERLQALADEIAAKFDWTSQQTID